MGRLFAIINLLREAWTALLSFRLRRAEERADAAEDRAEVAESYVETRKTLDAVPVAGGADDAREWLRSRNAARAAARKER